MNGIIDKTLKSWIKIDPHSDFPIQNLPFGIFSTVGKSPRVASIIGDYVIDLGACFDLGFFSTLDVTKDVFLQPKLNEFISHGKLISNGVRELLAIALSESSKAESRAHEFLIPVENVQMHMPVKVGDYTDFYSSREHATNVGTMFRDPNNALLPNWLHMPVGYHGRASSIVVSGTPIHRPKGQMIPVDSDQPVFGPCRLLDFELEMGFVLGKTNPLGTAITADEAEDYIFGMVVFNDWSARDIQKWEYVPLGPFLGKNFASTISPWIVTLEALDPFRIKGPDQKPGVLPYLKYQGNKNFNLNLEVSIETENGVKAIASRSNFKYMYWNMSQQLAHHTVNGCNMNVGDICASGTISGPDRSAFGSMLEISWKGTTPLDMPDGTQRKFLLDGDSVNMRAWGEKDGIRIGFGECSGKILPSK
jgi:fumarylacetoacetase